MNTLDKMFSGDYVPSKPTLEEKKKSFMTILVRYNWYYFTCENEERDKADIEAMEFIQDISNTIKKELWWGYDGINYENKQRYIVFTNTGLRESYKDSKQGSEIDGCYFIEPYKEWKNKYFKVIKPIKKKA